MELSISLNYLRRQRGTDEKRSLARTAEICRAAGFAYADYTPDFRSEDWEERAHRDREILDAAGITVEQTHAPFNRYNAYDAALFDTYVDRVFAASAILGARYVVVHADEYRTRDRYDPEEILDYTYGFLAPRVEFAAARGMTVAVENLFEDVIPWCPQIGGRSRYGSKVEELLAVIDRFDTPHVACCWDFGHGKCSYGGDAAAALRQVAKHLVCTHVHDNYYGKDLHVMPFMGDLDWEGHMACLREAGYRGKLSFEFAYGCLPEALLPVWLDGVHAAGEYLAGLCERGVR